LSTFDLNYKKGIFSRGGFVGKLIVIDGNDGSGKHTQAEMLRSYILNLRRRVLMLSFPRYEDTFFGRILREALDGKFGNFVDLDPHLVAPLYAADRWASKHHIKTTLADGGYVVLDRYVSANQIHQGGKFQDELERVNFLAWLDQLEYGEYRLPKPDFSVYLDVPLEVSLGLLNSKNRDTAENNHRYLENSHKSAQWLIARNPDKWIHVECVRDGVLRSREEIHDELIRELSARNVF
jgi:thymidylate kinase